jgi:hypothetical protein
MTPDEQVKHLTALLCEQHLCREILEGIRISQDKFFTEKDQRHATVVEERDYLLQEVQRIRDALKVARYSMPAKVRAKFDGTFNANMGAK